MVKLISELEMERKNIILNVGTYELILPNGFIIQLDNYYFVSAISWNFISIFFSK